jgi:hypothetical protein
LTPTCCFPCGGIALGGGGPGKDNMGYSVVEVHMGCMMLRVLHYNLGCMKAHVYAQEYAYLVGVKDSWVVWGCPPPPVVGGGGERNE